MAATLYWPNQVISQADWKGGEQTPPSMEGRAESHRRQYAAGRRRTEAVTASSLPSEL